MYAIILGAFSVLLAGFIQSVTGFGFALVTTPLLLFTIDARSVVVIVVILACINNILLLLRFHRYADRRRVIFICLGSAFGIPIGAYLLSSLDSAIIKLMIAALIIPFSILLLRGYSFYLKRDIPGCAVAGVISGTLAASTSLGGPPVILFLLGQDLSKEEFIGTISAYFLFASIVTISTFSFMGLVTADILKQVGILLPTMAVGFFIGNKVRHRIGAVLFKKIAAFVVLASALAIIITTLPKI